MTQYLKAILYLCVVSALVVTSCDTNDFVSSQDGEKSPAIKMQSESSHGAISQDRENLNPNSILDMQAVNQRFADNGINVRLAYAETVTLKNTTANRKKKGKKAVKSGGKQEAGGQTIFADDRTKRLDAQWVPGDVRRNATGNKLTYLIGQTWLPANFGTADEVNGEPAIDASFDTWNNLKNNPKLNIIKVPDTGQQPSAFFLGGNPFLADISEIGFLPGILFDIVLGPGARSSVLGVTFTSVFVDGAGNPTDINNDGYADIAFKEVWYNDAFLWTTDANGPGTDIETVALHENGHALGFGHLGKIFITNGNGKLHVAPRAVMNAIILGTQRDLIGTDKASYNSIYGHWPQ